LNRVVKDYLVLFGVGGTSIALDQWTKWLVRTNIEFGTQWLPESLSWLSPYARIVHWYNSGAAFGMFQNGNIVFTILAFIVIGAIIYYYPRVEADDWTLKLAMGLQLGGAAGNLIDRLRVGRVTDFISVGSFPVFNIADASISVGVAVLLLGVWINERNENLKAAEQASENGEQLSANDESLPALDPVDGPVSGEQPKMNGGQS
jgi:signal peptidase II